MLAQSAIWMLTVSSGHSRECMRTNDSIIPTRRSKLRLLRRYYEIYVYPEFIVTNN